MNWGNPALALLARRKFAGGLRRQLRRLRSPTGAAFGLLGLGAIGIWIAMVLFGARGSQSAIDGAGARVVGMMFLVMSTINALSFRGLYLPREEIELLFCAPISRRDVIRYRLWTALGKSLFGAFFFGVLASIRAPVPLFGFLGGFLAMMTLPVAAQIVSLYAGDAENRWFKRVPHGALRAVNAVGLVVILAVLLFHGRDLELAGSHSGLPFLSELPSHPVVRALTLPVWPWVELSTARDPARFAGLLALCLGIWWLLFEACARVRVDYRELSLETSADVARRLARLRKGGAGAASGRADASAAGWRVPWLFGRGAFGALAWRKTGSILRKARGTIAVSGALVSLIVLGTLFLPNDDGPTGVFVSCAIIATAGTLYICSGLRFDFREDLDRMDVVRSWPIAPWRVFLATLLPEIVLVVVVLTLAIVARASIGGEFPPTVFAILALLGPSVLSWTAIDNIVFLIWPQRLTPGSEGLLQQAGRSMLLMVLRFWATAVVAALAGLLAWVAFLLSDAVRVPFAVGFAVSVFAAFWVLCAECILLVRLGGRALARFDVARDR